MRRVERSEAVPVEICALAGWNERSENLDALAASAASGAPRIRAERLAVHDAGDYLRLRGEAGEPGVNGNRLAHVRRVEDAAGRAGESARARVYRQIEKQDRIGNRPLHRDARVHIHVAVADDHQLSADAV